MLTSDRASNWKSRKSGGTNALPVGLSFVLSMSALGVLAQEEAGAAQKQEPAVSSVVTTTQPSARGGVTTQEPAASGVVTTQEPAASGVVTTPEHSDRLVETSPEHSDRVAAVGSETAPGPEAPLRNVELLDRLDDDRLPTRPGHLLKARFRQVRRAQDEKILQLLLICVGFVGVFVAILALRSVPPSRSSS